MRDESHGAVERLRMEVDRMAGLFLAIRARQARRRLPVPRISAGRGRSRGQAVRPAKLSLVDAEQVLDLPGVQPPELRRERVQGQRPFLRPDP